MEQKSQKENRIILFGPAGVGRVEIFNKWTGQNIEETNELSQKIAANGQTNIGDIKISVRNIPDQPNPELITTDIQLALQDVSSAALVLIIDRATLENRDSLSNFLAICQKNSNNTKLKIVVNKAADEVEEDLKKSGNEIFEEAKDNDILPNSFSIEKDLIYYTVNPVHEAPSLVDESQLIQDHIVQVNQVLSIVNESHTPDPIIQSLIEDGFFLKKDEELTYELQKQVDNRVIVIGKFQQFLNWLDSFKLPELDWSQFWPDLKLELRKREPKFILAGKILGFVVLVALLTAAFGAIGFGIGAAAGAWSGPGAFLTAIAGVFAGAITAWNLAILIIAPVLGLTIAGIGWFTFEHRNDPPPIDPHLDIGPELGASINLDPPNDLSSNSLPHPIVTENDSKRVFIGDPQPKPNTIENSPQIKKPIPPQKKFVSNIEPEPEIGASTNLLPEDEPSGKPNTFSQQQRRE